MVRRTANVIHALVVKIVGQIGGDVGRAVANGRSDQWRNHWQLAEQPRLVYDGRAVAARSVRCQLQRIGDIRSLHRGAELPPSRRLQCKRLPGSGTMM